MTAATAATATRPTRLERSGVFLLWEVGSCSNTVRVVSVYAARMAVEKTPGRFIMISPRVGSRGGGDSADCSPTTDDN